MAFARREGHRVHWAGTGEGAPVLLVPGLGSGMKLFGTLPRRFARAGFRCLTVDPVGIAPSSPHEGEFDPAGAADDLVAVLDAAKAPRAALVGTSLGGKIALTCAARWPGRIERLVLLASSLVATPRARRILRFFEITAARLPAAELGEAFAPFLFGRTFQRTKPRIVADIVRAMRPDAARRALMVAQSRAMQHHDPAPLAAKVRCPTLFVAGAEDTLTPAEEVALSARLVAGARFVSIEHAGHSLLLESAETFAHVSAFLR